MRGSSAHPTHAHRHRYAVVVAGGGPTGMMLAAELTLAGVEVVVVERRADADLLGSRAGGLHSRTIEVLDQRGIAGRFLAEGTAMQVQSFATIPLDISDFPTRHNYGLALWQRDFERILNGWGRELGVAVLRGREVVGLAQGDEGVTVELAGGERLAAQYLVGCDGGRSVVRKAAGIEFAGWDPTKSTLIAEVSVTDDTPRGVHRDAAGVHGLHRMEDGTTVRVVVTEQRLGPTGEPTLDELRAALRAVFGRDFGVHDPTWISRFTDMTRQAVSYRRGRVLLAGDAAHVHYPVGGQGLNTGVQDAVNLGWKLAQVVSGISPGELLDTYHAERHPVAARVLHNTMAQTALTHSDARTDALRDAMTELLGMDEPRKRFAGMISGLDIHYELDGAAGVDCAGAHPMAGWRVPDVDLRTADGSTRMFELLHGARPVLVVLDRPGRVDLALAPWAGRLRVVDADYGGTWELPVLGEVPAPESVLVRPDGHVAWAGTPSDRGLQRAAEQWFGPGVRG